MKILVFLMFLARKKFDFKQIKLYTIEIERSMNSILSLYNKYPCSTF